MTSLELTSDRDCTSHINASGRLQGVVSEVCSPACSKTNLTKPYANDIDSIISLRSVSRALEILRVVIMLAMASHMVPSAQGLPGPVTGLLNHPIADHGFYSLNLTLAHLALSYTWDK